MKECVVRLKRFDLKKHKLFVSCRDLSKELIKKQRFPAMKDCVVRIERIDLKKHKLFELCRDLSKEHISYDLRPKSQPNPPLIKKTQSQ